MLRWLGVERSERPGGRSLLTCSMSAGEAPKLFKRARYCSEGWKPIPARSISACTRTLAPPKSIHTITSSRVRGVDGNAELAAPAGKAPNTRARIKAKMEIPLIKVQQG